MGLIRLVILIILLALLYRFWRQWRAGRAARQSKPPVDQGKMIACKHCGLYLPERDALRDGDDFYCSEAHRRAAQSRD